MAGKRRKKITEPQITGLMYFDKLAPLLERLHDDGCARDRAGNRKLHYDQYCLLILLYLFNPVVTSLRGLQQTSELTKAGLPAGGLGLALRGHQRLRPRSVEGDCGRIGPGITATRPRSAVTRRARRFDGRRWHVALAAAETDAGFVSETDDWQRSGQMATADALRGGSLRAHENRCDAQCWRATRRTGRVGTHGRSRSH
jgi:hypothetical protein